MKENRNQFTLIFGKVFVFIFKLLGKCIIIAIYGIARLGELVFGTIANMLKQYISIS